MRKISDVKELKEEVIVVERKISDFSNMDLSHLDLSKFEPEFWEGAIFYNTNLSNTGIRFNPRSLENHTIEKCNFENVDLSYIEENQWRWFNITDANLRNTGVKINISKCYDGYNNDKTIGKVLLDESYSRKPAEYWDNCSIDFSTLRANPFIHISSYKLFRLIKESIERKCTFLTQNQIIKLVKQCEGLMKEFDNGELTRLYKIISKNFDYLDKLKFFQGIVEGKVYQNVVLSDFPVQLLSVITFSNCSFEKMELNNKVEELLGSNISFFSQNSNNNFQSIYFPKLNLDSWRDLKSSNNSLGSITFKRFLYLEIGMKCNCSCKFCRNKSFDGKCKVPNMDRILENLEIMKKYVNTIFIGGGEPTFYLDEIIKIYENFRNIIIVTNGTLGKDAIDKIVKNNLSIYISRHSISEEENRSILNPQDQSSILSMSDIGNLTKKTKVALTPVCVDGGLDNSQKIIEYIAMSFELGIKEILVSTLHEDASMGRKGINYENLYVDKSILKDVFSTLLYQGFKRKRTICSTGGYILERFVKNYHYTVSFKIYISKEQFPKYWKECVKRTFDFTMTSNGDVYQDWCREELINLEELKALDEA